MTRGRDIPSIQYRSERMVNLTIPQAINVEHYEIRGAARVNDAYGPGAGVGGFGTIPMFQVKNGRTYFSDSVARRGLPAIEETNRKLTRAVYDPNDFSTPFDPSNSYLPQDEQVSFIRIAAYDKALGTYLPEGPIVAVPTPDFFTTKNPVFTFTGKSPNVTPDPPLMYPDVMLEGMMNVMFPGYSATVVIRNLDNANPLCVAFHPSNPPFVILPEKSLSLTGVGAPEIFLGGIGGNPEFSVALSIVNGA